MSVTPIQTAPMPVPVPPPTSQQCKSDMTEIKQSPSPPAHIVSDIPGASAPTSTPATTTTAAAALPSINGLAFRSSGSPAANSQPPPPAAPVIVKWRAEPNDAASKPPPPKTPKQKVPIMDPGTGMPASAPKKNSGFPSPGREHIHSLPKFNDDRTRIAFGIQQALPEAVRRAVRDNWEKCLLGSDFHQAFVLNATIHHATPAAIRQGIEGFGKQLVTHARNEIVGHMSTADLDRLATRIIAKASDSFLDKALEKRLKTINAKHLINALARAERLGYDPSDVQEDEPDAAALAAAVASTPNPQGSSSIVPQNAASSQPGMPLHCDFCYRRFPAPSAHNYHTKHKVCHRTPNSPAGFKYSCEYCGQGFTNLSGLNYHNANKTCGDFGQPHSYQNSPAQTQTHTQTQVPTPKTTTTKSAYATPLSSQKPQAATAAVAAAAAAAEASPSDSQDPYSHLSPEQIRSLQADLDAAEAKYSDRMREANANPDVEYRRTRLAKLCNSFSTKQSMVRKKYGIRLRLRRSKDEIDAERKRVTYKSATELQTELGLDVGKVGKAKWRHSLGGGGGNTGRGSRPGSSDTQGQMSTPEPAAATTLASSLSVPQQSMKLGNDVSMHSGHKRSHTGDGESPSHKRIAYAEMGGLGGDASMGAETMDPTMATVIQKQQQQTGGVGTADEPMMLDDSGTASGEDDDDDGSDSEDDDDEDIPAQLPASVLQSLQRSSSTATASPRPGSG